MVSQGRPAPVGGSGAVLKVPDAAGNGFERALSAFRERDYLLNKSVSVQTREGPVVGEAAGIDDHGALLVELPHRHIRRFHSGDVTLH